jgi:hypothetical protein
MSRQKSKGHTGIAEVAADTMALDSSGTLHKLSADFVYFATNSSYISHLYYTTWTKSGESVQVIDEVGRGNPKSSLPKLLRAVA